MGMPRTISVAASRMLHGLVDSPVLASERLHCFAISMDRALMTQDGAAAAKQLLVSYQRMQAILSFAVCVLGEVVCASRRGSMLQDRQAWPQQSKRCRPDC
jgi:hypothetical protein